MSSYNYWHEHSFGQMFLLLLLCPCVILFINSILKQMLLLLLYNSLPVFSFLLYLSLLSSSFHIVVTGTSFIMFQGIKYGKMATSRQRKQGSRLNQPLWRAINIFIQTEVSSHNYKNINLQIFTSIHSVLTMQISSMPLPVDKTDVWNT